MSDIFLSGWAILGYISVFIVIVFFTDNDLGFFLGCFALLFAFVFWLSPNTVKYECPKGTVLYTAKGATFCAIAPIEKDQPK